MLLPYSRMTLIRSVFLVHMIFLFSPPARGDVEVSCVFMESCILPCEFQAGAEVLIHWIQVSAGDVQVHSYYHNQDQFIHQNQRFRGRTKLFNDQISRRNASLQLTGVQVKDQGRYKCYTRTISGIKESFINLKVDAPVRKVDVHQTENIITCRSDGIYPEPELTWSTSPQSSVTIRNITVVLQTQQQLYNIISWLILSDSGGDLTFSCTLNTQSSSRTASLKTPHASTDVAAIVGGMLGAIFLVVLIVLGVRWAKNQRKASQQQIPEPLNSVSTETPEKIPLKTENGGG